MTSPDKDGFVGLLTARAAAEPDRVYARFNGEPLNYAELERRSAAFARAMASSRWACRPAPAMPASKVFSWLRATW